MHYSKVEVENAQEIHCLTAVALAPLPTPRSAEFTL
jgi:hypothetical protein